MFISEYCKNTDEILALFKDTFNREMSLDYWEWRYDKGPIDEKYIKLMWAGKKLVGHYAIFPVYLRLNNEILKTGFSMTTMTSPLYRGKGIFITLARSLYEDNFNNLNIIWGFPNENSIHGFRKYLGWKYLSDINMLLLKLDEFKNVKSNKFDNIVETDYFNKDYNDLIYSMSEKYKVIVNKDSSYFNWRYFSNPINKYYLYEYREDNELIGYCVCKLFKIDKHLEGDIVDIFCNNEESFKLIVFYSLQKMKKLGCIYANTWMMDIKYRQILYNIGFQETNRITHFGLKLNSDNPNNETLLDFKNWYITMGDSDVF